MASRLEQTRLLHADYEQQQRHAIEELALEPTETRERVSVDGHVRARVRRLHELGQRLVEIYDDADGARKEEWAAMSGEHVFTAFYERMKDTRLYWQRLGGTETAAELAEAKSDPDADLTLDKFTPGEVNGMFLDLHAFFERFTNLSQGERIDYLTYLGKFEKLAAIPRDAKLKPKKTEEYKRYIDELLAYLISFHERTQPFADTAKLIALIEEDFAGRWEAKTLPGWFGTGPAGPAPRSAAAVSAATTAAVTAALEGKEKTAEDKKEAKENKESKSGPVSAASHEGNPLYCSPCQQLYTKDTVYKAHLSGKKHKKAAAALEAATAAANAAAAAVPPAASSSSAPAPSAPTVIHPKDARVQAISRALALTEDKILQFAELLRDRIAATIVRVEKKQTLSPGELEQDLQLAVEPDVPEEEEDKSIYNPHNVPLGWDGKPIPYWLYKLHGLNIEYKCQICGGFSYRGPRNFERHFKEWRHEWGMRCLGIKNTDEFVNITRFEDAIALNEKLQKLNALSSFKPDEDEECEDREGNVFSKKQFDELKRQGIIS